MKGGERANKSFKNIKSTSNFADVLIMECILKSVLEMCQLLLQTE